MDFPKYSYDLLVQLNNEIPVPDMPRTAALAASFDEREVRKGIWFAAQRALVDSLIDQFNRENEDDGTDGDALRPEGSRFGRVLPADLNIREAAVGGDVEVDVGPLVGVRHLGSL